MIDALLVLVLFVAVAAIVVLIVAAAGATDSGESSPFLQALPLLVLLGCVLFYFIYFPSSPTNDYDKSVLLRVLADF